MRNITEKRMPTARWEMVEFHFTSPDTDFVITHSLDPINAWDVRWIVVDQNEAGVLYRGTKAPTTGYIVLRASVVGTYRIRLFIEAKTGETNALPVHV